MSDKKFPREGSIHHLDELASLPLPIGMSTRICHQIGNVRNIAAGAIEIFICPDCDKTHLKIGYHSPLGLVYMETTLEPQVAELLARMLTNPQTPAP